MVQNYFAVGMKLANHFVFVIACTESSVDLAVGKTKIGLRQVIGINNLIKISTYRLACRDSEITWVG